MKAAGCRKPVGDSAGAKKHFVYDSRFSAKILILKTLQTKGEKHKDGKIRNEEKKCACLDKIANRKKNSEAKSEYKPISLDDSLGESEGAFF